MKNSEAEKKTPSFDGNILLFYSFDVGDHIDLKQIEEKGLLSTHTVPLSSYFKNYHIPLSFHLTNGKEPQAASDDCIISKIHHFGVLSFCYRIPFSSTLENLKVKLRDTKQQYDKKSELNAKAVFNKIESAIDDSIFYNLKNPYFALHVNPVSSIKPLEFKELYGDKIASLLRLEIKELSEHQVTDILSSQTSYYGQDLIIIDGEGSCIYDQEYFEAVEFFESTNVQQLELQYFDRLLDEELTIFYQQPTFKIPFMAYIPFASKQVATPISRLSKLRVDISVVTERLENSIKMAGDSYYSKLYALLTEKFGLRGWRESINRKLNIIQDLYQVHQDRLDTIHGEVLELIIIVLITIEIVMAFVK